MHQKILRSHDWFQRKGLDGFIYRSWLRNQGLPDDALDGRPVIGICNSWSDLTPCNGHFRELAEHVKKGVLDAGGLPLEFPVMSLGETLMRPTAMLYRNLAAMDVEETLRANPIDGVVLLMGCDKTTPALMMGAASVDLPTIGLSGGPMKKAHYQGEPISVTMMWKMSEDVRAGKMSQADFHGVESCLNSSIGHCMIMGTASTMAAMVEALGIGLPGNADTPAVDAGRSRLAREAGRRAVALALAGTKMSSICTTKAFENAIRVLAAVGGSTNAVIHLTAIARRLDLPLKLTDFDRLTDGIPSLVDIQPAGTKVMEDFYRAGGIRAVMHELGLAGLLHGECLTITGAPILSYYEGAKVFDRQTIYAFDKPFKANQSLAVLEGNLCPAGAVIKVAAASPGLLQHKGPAVVFDSVDVLNERMADENFDFSDDSVLVLRNCGPKGYPGMPEVGNMPLPQKVLQRGVRDMVRITDARMSGSAFGTVVLHVSPEATSGGPLAIVEDGDTVELDVAGRRLTLHISDELMAARLAKLQQNTASRPRAAPRSGYVGMYRAHVNEASEGADLDFLVGCRGDAVPRDSH
jgi:L-arabonate dehydrase